MYRKSHNGQLDIYDFILPFGGHLKANNRWVVLRKKINWDIIEEEYSKNFDNQDKGQEAYPADVAFGSLYIQKQLECTDRELVEQIAENPYMQYFIGYNEYRNEKPFDASLLVTFRKRFPEEVMSRIIEKMFINAADDDDHHQSGGGGKSDFDANTEDPAGAAPDSKNRGTLIIDATCAPADIAFPTDLELCDKARRWTEVIIDHLWRLYGPINGRTEKPGTYREVARSRFLKLIKRRKKSAKKIRQELRYQLNCIERNLGYIEDYILLCGPDELSKIERERLETIFKVYAQQKKMLVSKTHSVPDRIVSLSQPWIRPIVRGKSKAPTEFGVKISVSVVNGYTFIDRMSFDAYNEGDAEEFVHVVEEFRRRFGHYPERILADKIYRSSHNRAFCKEHGIRMSGPKLGRPGKTHAEDLRQELKEIGERNEVEGKFGIGKRKLGLSRIMAKLKETTGSMIGMDIFILNMERFLRQEVSFLCAILRYCIRLDDIQFFNAEQLLQLAAC